jgi:putative transposase
MPGGLKRFHQSGQCHFITVSCFRRQPFLGTALLRDRFQEILLETIGRYQAALIAYVIMPEHLHLILTEPEIASIATVLQVMKQRYSIAMKKLEPDLYQRLQKKTAHPPPCPIWETRYYDFNLNRLSTQKQKIAYIHFNPVRRGLTKKMEEWRWSSYSVYAIASRQMYHGEDLQ